MAGRLHSSDRHGVFGSLNNATDSSALSSDECPVMRNVEHHVGGATRKRRGYRVRSQIRAHPEVGCRPVVTQATDPEGALEAGVKHWFKVTHATVAGETGDRHEPTAVFTPNGATPAVDVTLPFHSRALTVAGWWEVDPTGPPPIPLPALPDYPPGVEFVSMIQVDPPLVTPDESCPEAWVGALLYSRAPRVQDATRRGANKNAAAPTYNRLKELAKVYAVGTYDAGDGLGARQVLVLDRRIPKLGGTGKIDRDTVDVMLDDRDGLPLLWFNVYACTGGSPNGPWRLAGVGTTGAGAVRVTALDLAGGSPPSGRVNSSPPSVTVVDETDRLPGSQGIVAANTGIEGGVYSFKLTFSIRDESLMYAPGWEDAWAAAGLSAQRPHLRANQQTWPSTGTVVTMRDGQGLRVTPPLSTGDPLTGFPPTATGWNLYVARLEPTETLGFTAGVAAETDPFERDTPSAWYAGDADLSDSAAGALVTDALLALDPRDKWDAPGFREFATSSVQGNGYNPGLRGFPPSYEDLYSADEDVFAWGSSRDGITRNNMMFVIPVPAGRVFTTTHASVRIVMRPRRGSAASYNPGDTARVNVRRWRAGTATWETVYPDMTPEPVLRWHEAGFTWGVNDLVSFGGRYYLVLDVTGTNGCGFDVDELEVPLFRATDDAGVDLTPASSHVIQGRELAIGETYRIHMPLASEPGDERLRSNNTAMWPVVAYVAEAVNDNAARSDVNWTFAGVADSLFREKPDGTFERLHQFEDDCYAHVVGNDWNFAPHLNRLFVCNPGMPRRNLRFDGLQTWLMGIANPDQERTWYEDGPFRGEKGEIVSRSEAGGGDTVEIEVDYYLVLRRRWDVEVLGMVTRSAPFQWIEKTTIKVKEGSVSALVLEGTICVEPQVEAIELYRNFVGSGIEYGRTQVFEITDDVVDANGCVHVRFEDLIDGTDADLDLGIDFDVTGPPPAAVMMIPHDERIFFVPQGQREVEGFTNLTSPAGDPNPEGFHEHNVATPTQGATEAVRSLSVYGGNVAASSMTGMGLTEGISKDLNSPAGIGASKINASTGWIGPRAWASKNAIQYGITPLGPGILHGGELELIGERVRGTIEPSDISPDVVQTAWCVLRPETLRNQILFGYTHEEGGRIDSALVLDEQVTDKGKTLYWAEWTELPFHSASCVKGGYNEQNVLAGGHQGLVFDFGDHDTDAGCFIDAEVDSRPFGEGEVGKSAQPRWIYFDVGGNRQHVALARVRRDGNAIATVNDEAIRLRCDDARIVEDGYEQEVPLAGVGEFLFGDVTTEWGGEPRHLGRDRRTAHGRVMHQIQVGVYQRYEEMPVGSPRESTFECAGYVLFYQAKGPRRAA